MSVCRYLLIRGPPGIGKTTALKTAILDLQGSKIPCDGFYTEELRNDGYRIGFDVISIKNKQRKPLARLNDGQRDCVTVGPYAVNINEFESVIRPILSQQRNTLEVLFIDEIGKMECLSPYFNKKILKLFGKSSPYNLIIVATIPEYGNNQVVNRICNVSPDIQILNMDKDRRNAIPIQIIDIVGQSFNHFRTRSSTS